MMGDGWKSRRGLVPLRGWAQGEGVSQGEVAQSGELPPERWRVGVGVRVGEGEQVLTFDETQVSWGSGRWVGGVGRSEFWLMYVSDQDVDLKLIWSDHLLPSPVITTISLAPCSFIPLHR